MSRSTDINDNLPSYPEHARPPTIYFHPNDPTIAKHRICSPPLTCNRGHWPPKSTNRSPRTPSTGRDPSCSHPLPHYRRNIQLTHPTPSPRSATNRQPYSRPPANSTHRHRRICSPPDNANRSHPDSHRPISLNSSGSSSSNDSSLRICPSPHPLPTRKHLMAHQAHAYHMVDPSP